MRYIAVLCLLPLTASLAEEKSAPVRTVDADAAIAKGIAWLKARAKDGVWYAPDPRDGKMYPNAAFTAFAITPIAASLPKDRRADHPLVKKGCEFLLANLQEDGAVRQGPASKYDNYFTCVSLLALETVGDPDHAEARKKMRGFIRTMQRREEGRIEGGFGYNTAKSADLSNTQFAIEALRAAGVPEDDPAMKQALEYLERVQNRSENDAHQDGPVEVKHKEKGKVKVVPGDDGSAGYEPGVSKAGLRKLPDGTYVPRGYGSMTYALLKCYILVGVDPKDPRVQAVLDWIGENYTWEVNPGFDHAAKTQPEAVYWGLYYYYMTASKALHECGIETIETPDGPKDWSADLKAAIVKRQRDDGSWKNTGSARWNEAMPLIATCYSLIALQEIRAAEAKEGPAEVGDAG